MRNASAITGTVLILFGCGGGNPFAPPQPPFVPTGFVCTTSPSDAYSPGYVYRIDQSGSELLVEDFSDIAKTRSYRMALGDYSASIARSAGLGIALTQPVGTVDAKADASAGSTTNTIVSFKSGQLVQMTDPGEQAIIDVATEGLERRTGSRYFVVRDAIKAGGILIKVSSTDEAKLGGEGAIKSLVSISPGFSFARGETLDISGDFEPPLNVCIRASEMLPVVADPAAPGGLPGAAGWTIRDEPASIADTLLIVGESR